MLSIHPHICLPPLPALKSLSTQTKTSAATFNLPNSGPSTVNTITSPNTNGPDTPYIVAQSEGSCDFANSAYDYDLGYEYSPGHYQ